jgi:methylmalonyl-CoA/ethylmalonyl-CoA epimerase
VAIMAVLPPVLSGDAATVAQVCLLVPDLDEALRAHTRITRSGPFSIWTYDQNFFATSTYRGEPGTFAARIAINPQQPQFEYVELLQGPSVFHEHLETHGFGMHHFGFSVQDVGIVTEEMEAAGFPMVQHATGWGLDGDGEAAFYDTTAALGVWTEAVSRPARRRPPEATFPASGGD